MLRGRPPTPRKTKRRKAIVQMAHHPKRCKSFFLDSGAHTLYTIHVIEKKNANGFAWYRGPEFRAYLDQYARFVKKYKSGMDLYANVDVIFDPELSWKALKYLEDEHGLNPVPVIHFGTSMKWIDKHLDAGYKLLGIGGLGQEVTRDAYLSWGDRLFSHLCPGPSHLPVVRTHGFAMTSFRLMARYPWWSVDSVSWAKAAGVGGQVFVPHRRYGKYDLLSQPYMVGVSHNSPFREQRGKHLDTLTPAARDVFLDWMKEIDMPIGAVDENGHTTEYGVVSEYAARATANIRYYDKFLATLPKWPWPYVSRKRKAFFGD